MTRSRTVSQKDRPFPKYAIDYFNQLRGQYELLLEQSNETAAPSIEKILERAARTPNETSWADVFALESAYLYALPSERLAAETEIFRDRFRSVAGTEAYQRYAPTVEADVWKIDPVRLRAELLALAEKIRYLYTFVPPKEHVRNQLVQNAVLLTVGFFAFSQGVSVWCLNSHKELPTILMVLFGGALGGFVSVLLRLNTPDGVDPLLKELQLRENWFSVVVVAPLSGAIFACVLYWLFLAQLLHGGLFPEFTSIKPKADETSWENFINNSAPSGALDYGKLLIWSFIAGFAERFVPDVLTRLTGQVEASPQPPKANARPAAGESRVEAPAGRTA